jgi:hypothetical protein
MGYRGKDFAAAFLKGSRKGFRKSLAVWVINIDDRGRLVPAGCEHARDHTLQRIGWAGSKDHILILIGIKKNTLENPQYLFRPDESSGRDIAWI